MLEESLSSPELLVLWELCSDLDLQLLLLLPRLHSLLKERPRTLRQRSNTQCLMKICMRGAKYYEYIKLHEYDYLN